VALSDVQVFRTVLDHPLLEGCPMGLRAENDRQQDQEQKNQVTM
jgi:hypothetical protein